MTNKLISLVVIIFILSVGRSYSEEQFLFPKEKPLKILPLDNINFAGF